MNRRELVLGVALLTIFLMPYCNAARRGAFTIEGSGVHADEEKKHITQRQQTTDMILKGQNYEQPFPRLSDRVNRIEYKDYEEPHANASHDPPIGAVHAEIRGADHVQPHAKTYQQPWSGKDLEVATLDDADCENARSNTSHDPKIGQ
ncbi:hypothetical protein KP509_28G028100 [Ceratopteris richardii]|uniref:Uncharacterized protein n=1 Tax=Ceratopteris richardii TaxID=49495 RepID=A0A8T2RAP2_CERRI|nr:hypothetical protein KP509_28G028100 [Ceratopteris richardii]